MVHPDRSRSWNLFTIYHSNTIQIIPEKLKNCKNEKKILCINPTHPNIMHIPAPEHDSGTDLDNSKTLKKSKEEKVYEQRLVF